MPQRAPPAWHSDMQLPGKLLLSAAALLLLSLAFRFCRNRSPPPGKIPPGEQREKRDGDGEKRDGGLRRRRRRDGGDKSGNGLGMRRAALRGGKSFPRSEEEEEEGEEVGSELVMIPRKDQLGPAGTGREVGAKLGWKLGIKSESEAGVELGNDPGSGTGKEPGSRLGTKPGNNPGRKPGSEPESKLVTKSGSEQANEPGNKLGTKSGTELGSEKRSEPGGKLGSELGGKAGAKLGSELGISLESELGGKAGARLGISLESELGGKAGAELGSELGISLESELGGKAGAKLGSELGISLESELGGKAGAELGSELGISPESELGGKAGVEVGSELGISLESELGGKAGARLGSELGISPESELGGKAGAKLGSELGISLGGKAGVEVGSELGISLESELGGKAGAKLGSELGISPESELGGKAGVEVGSELGSHAPGAEAAARGSPAGRDRDAPAPSSAGSPGVCDARTEGDGCARSAERDPAGAGRSSAGAARSLSVTSSLGLLLAASGAGADTAYCFSSVAKIQVEENFIPERRDKDRDSSPGPGLRGKVYDYFVQSVSESVSRRTSLPFVPAGTPQNRGQRGQAEPRSSGTRGQNPAVGIPDPNTSRAAEEDTESPPQPPSPGRSCSTLGIAPRPPGGAPAAAPEPSRVHLGNCSEVLRSAKARQLRGPQDAALQVMSQHLLQVLRSPHIYGRLKAGERELLPRLRSRGRPRLVVADVPPAEPGHRPGRLCYYDEDEDRWCQLCQLPAEVAGRGCAVCPMFNYLFVVPGGEGAGRARSPSRRVLCYDPLGDSWRDICPLRQARPHCQLVALDGHLYAIGGECLATVERYDPRRDRWAFVAALPRDTFAVAHAATACDGDIYVTGGTLRSLLLRYDARSDSWATSPAAGDKDRTAELLSAHGFLYRFQLRRGAGGTDVTVSRCSASARLWYRCGSRPLPEPPGLRCAALGGLVHCLGRGFHLRFLADPVSPRFGAKELRPFPAPHGSLLPAVLVLPEGGTEPPGL